MEMTNFIAIRAVLCNNYWSHNLIGPYRFWAISPRNSTSFTRQFHAGRYGGLVTTLGDFIVGVCTAVTMQCWQTWTCEEWVNYSSFIFWATHYSFFILGIISSSLVPTSEKTGTFCPAPSVLYHKYELLLQPSKTVLTHSWDCWAHTHKNDLLHWGWHWTLWHHYFFMTLITHTQYEADPETLWHHYFFKTIITHTQYVLS